MLVSLSGTDTADAFTDKYVKQWEIKDKQLVEILVLFDNEPMIITSGGNWIFDGMFNSEDSFNNYLVNYTEPYSGFSQVKIPKSLPASYQLDDTGKNRDFTKITLIDGEETDILQHESDCFFNYSYIMKEQSTFEIVSAHKLDRPAFHTIVDYPIECNGIFESLKQHDNNRTCPMQMIPQFNIRVEQICANADFYCKANV